jgi:hypothetical protein
MLKSRFNAIRDLDLTIESRLETVLSMNYIEECPSFYSNMVTWLEKARQRKEFI